MGKCFFNTQKSANLCFTLQFETLPHETRLELNLYYRSLADLRMIDLRTYDKR